MRRFLLLGGAIALLGLPACGGSGDDELAAPVDVETTESQSAGVTEASVPAWLGPILAREGADVAVVFSTSEYVPGTNRVGFLVIRNDGSIVAEPEATVWVGAEDAAEPVQTTARLVSLTPDGEPVDELDVTELYVTDVETPTTGRYWIAVEPEGGGIQALGALDVRDASASPPLGSQAPASDTPTLADAPGAEITTATPPDTELLRVSVADAIAAGEPFVVVFATPKFCQSRTCGPTVDVVDAVRRKLGDSGIRFIHVEIYQDNDPTKGVNQWVSEWGLPTEPWVFLVDGSGTVRAKFEGSVSQAELEDAVRANLL